LLPVLWAPRHAKCDPPSGQPSGRKA
jgi:hypothetical protein